MPDSESPRNGAGDRGRCVLVPRVERRILRAGLNCLAELLLPRKCEAEIGHRHEHRKQHRRRQAEFDRGYTAVAAEKAAQADDKAVARACSGDRLPP